MNSEERTPASTPERFCPRCGGGMRRLATLCAGCWLKVAPMGADGVEPPPLPLHHPWWRFWRR